MDKKFIQKYLDNQCDKGERESIELFLQQPGSEKLLDEVLTERLPADIETTKQDTAHKERWKAEIHLRIKKGAKIRRLPLLRHVAVWGTILFGIGFYSIYHYNRKDNKLQIVLSEKVNAAGQRAIIKLTDGSVILLGAESKLKYPESFNADTREITLEGEAFFEISNDPSRPFIVHTGDVQTRVLGTSFRISAFSGTPLTVAVATGKVQVEQQKGASTVLTPGRQLTLSPEATVTSVAVADIEGWKKARLTFNNKSLREVATELERWYNVKITFKQHKKEEEHITVVLFASASLDKTLQMLSIGSNFKYTVYNRQVIIK